MSTDELQIRPVRPAEFLALAELDRSAWQDGWIVDGEHVWRIWVDEALTYGAFSGAGDGAEQSAAELLGAVVAFPGLSGRFVLHKLFVRKDQRGAGIGRALLGELTRELDRRGRAAYLTVDPANQSARGLYRSLGFTEETHAPGYYRADEDRYLLERPARTRGSNPGSTGGDGIAESV